MPNIPNKLSTPSFRLRRSTHAEFSSRGHYLAQVGARVVIWDVVARKVVSEFKAIKNESHLAFSPDESKIAVKNTNGEFAFVDVRSGQSISTTGAFRYYGEGGKPVFLNDSLHVIDGSWNGVLRIYEVATGKVVDQREFGVGYMFTSMVRCSATGRVYAALTAKSGQKGGDLLLRFDSTFALDRYVDVPPVTRSQSEGHGWRGLEHLTLSPDGLCAAVFQNGSTLETPNTIEVIRLDGSGSLTAQLPSRHHDVRGMAFAQTGFLIATVHRHIVMGDAGYAAWVAAKAAAGACEHVHFFDIRTLELAQRWEWQDAWGVSVDPATDALVIASRETPGAYLAPRDWRPDSMISE